MALFKQMIGRGTRLFPDDDKLSFDIIDYSGATALFSDPDFDGPPELVLNEQIDDQGSIVDDTIIQEARTGSADTSGPDVEIDLDDLPEPLAKFYVDNAEVFVTAEAVYDLDSQTNKLRLIEYRDLVTELFDRSSQARMRFGGNGQTELADARFLTRSPRTGSMRTSWRIERVWSVRMSLMSWFTSPGTSHLPPESIGCDEYVRSMQTFSRRSSLQLVRFSTSYLIPMPRMGYPNSRTLQFCRYSPSPALARPWR